MRVDRFQMNARRPVFLHLSNSLSASNTKVEALSLALTDFAGGGISTIKRYPHMVPVAPKTAIQSAHSLLGQIGHTPLIRLAKVDEDLPGVEIYAKAEFFNPGRIES